MLRDYFSTVCKHLVAEHAELLSVERTNRRIMLTKGEVHVERKERAEMLQVLILSILKFWTKFHCRPSSYRLSC
jgi:regulator of nonsense transcripts 2